MRQTTFIPVCTFPIGNSWRYLFTELPCFRFRGKVLSVVLFPVGGGEGGCLLRARLDPLAPGAFDPLEVGVRVEVLPRATPNGYRRLNIPDVIVVYEQLLAPVPPPSDGSIVAHG